MHAVHWHFTWFRWGAVVVEYRVQEIAEVSFGWVSMHPVLPQHILTACNNDNISAPVCNACSLTLVQSNFFRIQIPT